MHVKVEVVVIAIGWWWLNGSSQNLRKNKETKKHIPLARKAFSMHMHTHAHMHREEHSLIKNVTKMKKWSLLRKQ